MSLFVFNNQQKLIKSIPNRDLISVVQDQAINVSDTLFVEMPADIWSKLKEPASYLAVQDPYERFSYHMYKVSKHTTKADTTDLEAIQIGYDELKAYGYIKDRRFNNRPVLEAATAVVNGTDWQIGYVDTDLPNVNTNFYYISRLEALSKLIEATGAEVRFRVEISGNKIIAKRLDLYKNLGIFKGKRFAYGSNLLEIVKEEDTSELYTALVGRGKGEETATGGFGRRITFADVAWNKASGKPVDKPLGQEFIELPEMTAYYGYPDGEPRTGIVEFGDIEEPEQLLKATYDRLVETSRPQVQFKAKVQATGDMQLGEEVAIIRSDLGFRYKTRVFRVKRDYLNNMFTEVELGDKLTETLASRIKKIDTTNARREETIIQYIQTAANGKNKIFRGPVEPTEGMMVNDLWYKPVGEGETMLYAWNGEIWELSKVSAGLLGGTLDAENGDVNLINVNVANIVGETSDFVLSNWNGASGGGVTIDGEGVKSVNTLGQGDYTYQRRGGIEFYAPNGHRTGSINTSYGDGQTSGSTGDQTGIGIFLRPNHNFNITRDNSSVSQPNKTLFRIEATEFGLDYLETYVRLSMAEQDIMNAKRILFKYGGTEIRNNNVNGLSLESDIDIRLTMSDIDVHKDYIKLTRLNKIEFFERLSMSDQNIINVNQYHLTNGASKLINNANDGATLISDNNVRLGITSEGTTHNYLEVSKGNLDIYWTIDMNGYTIEHTSDIRLKENITPSSVSGIAETKRLRVVEFDWKKNHPVTENYPEERQFGIIAQDSAFLQTKTGTSESYLSVDLMKQVNLNTLTNIEIIERLESLEERL